MRFSALSAAPFAALLLAMLVIGRPSPSGHASRSPNGNADDDNSSDGFDDSSDGFDDSAEGFLSHLIAAHEHGIPYSTIHDVNMTLASFGDRNACTPTRGDGWANDAGNAVVADKKYGWEAACGREVEIFGPHDRRFTGVIVDLGETSNGLQLSYSLFKHFADPEETKVFVGDYRFF